MLGADEFESLRLRSPQGAYLQALQSISDFNPKFIQSFWGIWRWMKDGDYFVERELDSENVKQYCRGVVLFLLIFLRQE